METPPPSSDPPVQWDDREVHSVQYPNFCNVAHSDRDFTLLFGTGKREGDVMKVTLSERVILQPLAAKLLGTLLSKSVASFEAKHGQLPEQFQAVPGSATLARTEPPLLDPAELPERGTLLLELIARLNVPYESERSFKMLPGAVLTRRFLLGLHQSRLTPQARTRLPVICKRLGMPQAFLDEFAAGLDAAQFVHFGFEESEQGSLYKVYLEAPSRTALAAPPGKPLEPFELYRGFKWDGERSSITRYVANPGLAPDAIHARLAELVAGAELAAARAVLALAAERSEPRKLLFVEAVEDGNPRRSFDLNLYSAKLQLAEIYPLLRDLARAYGCDLAPAYEKHKTRSLGHVAGGRDRHGRGFFSVYFGGQPI
jgi:hypothetical protein